MLRLRIRASNFTFIATTGKSHNYVKQISLKCPLSSIEKDTNQINDDKSSLNGWNAYLKDIISQASREWKRTKFFSEGGQHSIDHNIRPQQQFTISWAYVIISVIIFILLKIYTSERSDLANNNAYFASIKQKKGECNKDDEK